MTTPAPLPANVYRLPQKDFDAIPGSPWVYWVSENIRDLFRKLQKLEDIARPTVGLQTGENSRFLRYWWEIGQRRVAFTTEDRLKALQADKKWFPYMKGGTVRKWHGNQDYVVNWQNDGYEIRNFFDGDYLRSRPQNTDYYFKEGITWSDLSSTGFAVRYLPTGFIFDVKGSSGFPGKKNLFSAIAVMNSSWMNYALGLLNPTVSFQVGDIARVPFREPNEEQRQLLESSVVAAIHIRQFQAIIEEKTFDFIAPLSWLSGFQDLGQAETRLQRLESQIDDEVFALYGISPADRAAIDVELAGGQLSEAEESGEEAPKSDDDEDIPQSISLAELAARWVSYAIGVVLGRFQPGVAGALGRAVYRRDAFAIGSLPAPDEAEFEQLVGFLPSSPGSGAGGEGGYTDEQGGRHVFSAEVERALLALSVPDGITVLCAGHPRDLAARVEQALALMLGETGAAEVIAAVTGDNQSTTPALRTFLEKDYFTRWHFKWYRKRPVYWPIQSAKRAYGFVLFHEKITRDTFYAIQRDPYLDTQRNAIALQISDLQSSAASLQGAARKKAEKALDDLRKQTVELAEFAKALEAITLGGYEPEPNWKDDGVILRLAPLWPVLPIWKSEPKKYWERLEAGDFDWSHIAMRYWPERVKAKCKTNKSYAIAHGHEEWYAKEG